MRRPPARKKSKGSFVCSWCFLPEWNASGIALFPARFSGVTRHGIGQRRTVDFAISRRPFQGVVVDEAPAVDAGGGASIRADAGRVDGEFVAVSLPQTVAESAGRIE